MPSKIFLDCGAHNGCSVRHFKKIRPDWKEFQIHSFEPNQTLFESLLKEDCYAYNTAIWIEDGEVDFYEVGTTGASTLNQQKANWNVDPNRRGTVHKNQKLVKVTCLDLDRYVRETYNRDDYIILKLDIEGSEYEVLDKMISNNSISYINELFIEFHNAKCGVSVDEDVRLTQEIERLGIKVKTWNALGN